MRDRWLDWHAASGRDIQSSHRGVARSVLQMSSRKVRRANESYAGLADLSKSALSDAPQSSRTAAASTRPLSRGRIQDDGVRAPMNSSRRVGGNRDGTSQLCPFTRLNSNSTCPTRQGRARDEDGAAAHSRGLTIYTYKHTEESADSREHSAA